MLQYYADSSQSEASPHNKFPLHNNELHGVMLILMNIISIR